MKYAASVWNPHLYAALYRNVAYENAQSNGRALTCIKINNEKSVLFSVSYFVPPGLKNVQHQGYFTTSTFYENEFLTSLICVMLELPASICGKY